MQSSKVTRSELLSLQAHLLQQLRPTDFRSFGAFLTWRKDMSQLLVSVLGLAARETSRANSRLAASCRGHMVTIGCVYAGCSHIGCPINKMGMC